MLDHDHSTQTFIKDCIEWDVENWSKAFSFWQQQVNLEGRNYNCLELGGRGGGLSLWLASKGNKVICSDLNSPEEEASVLHRNYSVSGEIEYQAIDATHIPYENQFNIVIFKSILGGISRNGRDDLKRETIQQVLKALKPKGLLLFAENLEASALHKTMRKRFTNWGSYWNYLRLEELDGLFEGFENVKFHTAGFLGAFGKTEGQRAFLGRLDTLFFDRMMKDKMKYIVFGVASKP